MKTLIALLGLMVSTTALADPTVLRAAGLGWEMRFEAPPLTKLEETGTPADYHYAGSAGKFSLSVLIEQPRCGGGGPREQVMCFLGQLPSVPGLVTQSVKVKKAAQGVLVTYNTYTQIEGASTKVMHAHILFGDQLKWGDLHGAMARPEPADIATLQGLTESFSFSH